MHIQMTRLYEAARLLKGITTQAEIARVMGTTSQTVNNWESRGISRAGLLSAQAAFGCSATWLDTGEGPMTLADATPDIPGAMRVVVSTGEDPDFYQIPKVQLQLRAGVTGFQTVPEIYDGATVSIPKNWVDRRLYYPAALIAITIKGESMEPSLYEGDLVIVNTADKQQVDGAVYAVNYEGEAVVKRLSRDMGQWWLCSDNPDQRRFHRKSCNSGECIIVGRVVRKESDHI